MEASAIHHHDNSPFAPEELVPLERIHLAYPQYSASEVAQIDLAVVAAAVVAVAQICYFPNHLAAFSRSAAPFVINLIWLLCIQASLCRYKETKVHSGG